MRLKWAGRGFFFFPPSPPGRNSHSQKKMKCFKTEADSPHFFEADEAIGQRKIIYLYIPCVKNGYMSAEQQRTSLQTCVCQSA